MNLETFKRLWIVLCLSLATNLSLAQSPNVEQAALWLAPKADGKLRASINVGNPILATRDSPDHLPRGVSVELAQALAKELHLQLELLVFESAGQSVEAVRDDRADIGFFAIDPKRAQGIAFTSPYVMIEGSYLVRENSPLQSNAAVDRDGVKIAVGKGSAYDLFLSRTLEHATLIRASTSPAVVRLFMNEQLDVAAGVKQQLESDMKTVSGLRLLPGHFMVIEQAMGLPQSRSAQAQHYLDEFVQRMKREGKISQWLQIHHIQGATLAP